jgi:hypothetical protein
MSISSRKLAANRANAQKSTGPTSEAGRAVVSQNAVKHGLCGRFQVLPGEDQEEYNDLLARFMRSEEPADDVERELVAKMVRHTWLSTRAVKLQEGCFLVQPITPDQEARNVMGIAVRKELDVYVRYQTAQDRAYQRAAAELAKRKKERDLRERGFAREERAEAQEKRREEVHQLRTQKECFRVAAA